MEKEKFKTQRGNRIPLQGLSIKQRLPLLICILLLIIMVTFTWISYIGVKNASMKIGRDRLKSLTEQLGSMFAQSMQNLVTGTRTVANHESIRMCLSSGNIDACQNQEAIQRIRQDSTTVMVQLVSADRKTVLYSKDSLHTRSNFDSLLSLYFARPDSQAIGKIHKVGNSMYYPIVIPVTDGKQVLGYFVRWRMLQATQRTIEQFSQLIGTGARLFVGNKDGSLWTDMIDPVSYQPADTTAMKEAIQYVDQNGDKVLAFTKAIPQTPWLVSVEFSQQIILQAASTFLRWIVIIGSILLLIGIFIAWTMSRNLTRPLNQLTAAASSMAAGKVTASVAVDRRDEVGKLARAFNAMVVQIQQGKNNLEEQVREKEAMNQQLRDLSAHLQNIREDERMHIAREMHDELGQLLTGFKMDVSWLNKRMASSDDTALREKLGGMVVLIDDAVKFVRRLASELRPSILDDLGLVAAIQWHSNEFKKRYNIDVDLASNREELHVARDKATGIFRMYQESLTNVARHANAKSIKVNLDVSKEEISLAIKDDGKGFDPSLSRKTLGLLGMKERATAIGGTLEISSEPGSGTRIEIRVPC